MTHEEFEAWREMIRGQKLEKLKLYAGEDTAAYKIYKEVYKNNAGVEVICVPKMKEVENNDE